MNKYGLAIAVLAKLISAIQVVLTNTYTISIMASNTTHSEALMSHSGRSDVQALDVERAADERYGDQKLPLSSSWKNVRLEWQYGSKKRVIKYYSIAIIFVLLIGAGIGAVVALV
ncbi:hypothetical protein GQ44DRAFT_711202 [Phaeosphaeriaceae sp. PMI808]|nr:hypothetical protein GQ44DRAFT_711202 [Phaeosphaeriaceae sp. PMI808]